MSTYWFISRNGKPYGPITSAQLKKLAADSKITPQTNVRIGETGEWTRAGKVKGLFSEGIAPVPQSSVASRDEDTSVRSPMSIYPSQSMSYIDGNLLPRENVLYKAQIHWGVFVPPIVSFVALVLSLIPLFVAKEAELIIYISVTLAMIVVTIGTIGQALIIFLTTEFALTNKRVIGKTGLISRNSIEILNGKIESITVDQSILGRLFNYGTVIVTGAGSSKTSFTFISSPIDCRRAIQKVLEVD